MSWKIRNQKSGKILSPEFNDEGEAWAWLGMPDDDPRVQDFHIYDDAVVQGLREEGAVLAEETQKQVDDPYLKDEDMTTGETMASWAFPFGSEVARRGGEKSDILKASVVDAGINAVPALAGTTVMAKMGSKGIAPYVAGLATDALLSAGGDAGAQYAYTGEVDPIRTTVAGAMPGVGAGVSKLAGEALKKGAEKTLKYSIAKTDPMRRKISDESIRYALDDNVVPVLGGAKKLKSNIENKLAPFIKQQDMSIQEAVEQGFEVSPHQFMKEANAYITESGMSEQERKAVRKWVTNEVVAQVEGKGRATLTPDGVIKIRRDLKDLAEKGFTEGKEPTAVMGAESLTSGINRSLKDIVPGFKEPTEAMAPYMDVLSGANREALKPKSPTRLGDMLSLMAFGGAQTMGADVLPAIAGAGAISGFNRLGSTVGGARLQDLGGKGLVYLSDGLPMSAYSVPRSIYRAEEDDQ